MTTQTFSLHAEGLVCGRDGTAIVPALDVTLRQCAALIVTGDNGSGKSTLLRTLAGLLPPVAGRAWISGLLSADGEAVEGVGEAAHYLGHRNAMRPGDEVEANLLFWQRFFASDGDGDGVTPGEALELFGLPGVLQVPFGHLSAGQQRRAALARLLVVPRPIWLLDEPTAALDAASTARFEAVLSDHLEDGGIAVVATHLPLQLRNPARTLHLDAPLENAETSPWG